MNNSYFLTIEMQLNTLISLILAKEQRNLGMISEGEYRKFIEDTRNNFDDVMKSYFADIMKIYEMCRCNENL